MVRLRLQRLGRTHRPFYRLNAIDQRTRRNGRVIENLGWYNPIEQDVAKQVELKADRIQHWLSQGAQPSRTVRDLLAKHDVLNDKAKAEWEADRTVARNRVTAEVAVKKSEAILAELTEFAGAAEGEVNSFVDTAREAVKEAKDAKAQAAPESAAAAQEKAEQALAGAKKTEEEFQAKKAAEEAAAAKAAEEAAAAEGGNAEGGEAESETTEG